MGRVPEVRRWICGAVLARRHAFESAGFRVDSCSGEVLRDCFGRPISLDPQVAEIDCVRAMGDGPKPFRGTISIALESFMLSDNLSVVLCFTRGRSRGFRLPYPDQTFCMGVSGAQHQDQHQIDTERVQQQ